MALAWKPPAIKAIGVNDNRISPYHKVWIMQNDVCVVGVIGEGTSKSVQANWNSPFEGDSVGSKFEKVGGLVQTGMVSDATAGVTSITRLASTQVWSGNQPHVFSVNLILYAQSDPKAEVEDAIKALERMQAPHLEGGFPVSMDAALAFIGGDSSNSKLLGRVPTAININIGRNDIYNECVISSLSVPLEGARDANGYLTYAEVQIEIETKTLLNHNEIK